jgi:hypothetical protein
MQFDHEAAAKERAIKAAKTSAYNKAEQEYKVARKKYKEAELIIGAVQVQMNKARRNQDKLHRELKMATDKFNKLST